MKMRLVYVWMIIFSFDGVTGTTATGFADDWMQLEYIDNPDNCLQCEGINENLRITSCVEGDPTNKLWKLRKDGKLVSHKRMEYYCADPDHLMLRKCVESSKWICLPFALKTDPNSYLVVDSNLIRKVNRSDSYMRAEWRRFGDPTRTICGGSKLHWDLNNSSRIWPDHCSTCRSLFANSGALLPFDATKMLGDLRGTCFSDPDMCSNGLSFELWLWFADYDLRKNSTAKSVILQSGTESSRGYELSVVNANMTFTVYSEDYISESSLQIKNFERWVHVIGVWVDSTKMAQLFANGVDMGCVVMRKEGSVGGERGDLRLGPVSKIGFGKGFLVARNLSIWSRTMSGTERRKLLNQSAPVIPEAWTTWSNCTTKCEQKRWRKTRKALQFNVTITETRLCYNTRQCGSRIVYPLDEKSSLRCHKCRQLNASSALILPINSTRDLDDYKGMCLSQPELCVDGMTFEIWLWFAEYEDSGGPNGTILRAGKFQLSVASNKLTFTVFSYYYHECTAVTVAVTHSHKWLHVVGKWVKGSDSLSLNVNDQDSVYDSCIWKDHYGPLQHNSRLLLGPISKDGRGYIIAKNLSIWMRALNASELNDLTESSRPALKPHPWSHWTDCNHCQKTRYRHSPASNLWINETGMCCGNSTLPQRTKPTPPATFSNSPSQTMQKASSIAPTPAATSPQRTKPTPTATFSNSPSQTMQKASSSSIAPTPAATSSHGTHKTVSVTSKPTGPSNCIGTLEDKILEEKKSFCKDGWLVILNRTSGNLNFDQNWENYKNGFGEPRHEHWIGNEMLHKLTHEQNYKLKVYFNHNLTTSTTCGVFRVASKAEKFALKLSLCKGPAAHALSYSDGAMFSTHDNDNSGGKNCAENCGGFWHKHCAKVHFTCRRQGNRFTVSYLTENDKLVERRAVTMMIKPHNESFRGVAIKMKFVEETWDDELWNVSSHRFLLLAGKIKKNLEAVYRDDATYVAATINSFSPGSVIANVTLSYVVVNGTQITTLLQDLDSEFLNGEMRVSYNYSDVRILSVSNYWPRIKELHNTSSTSFYVSWEPFDNMSEVKHYNVYYLSLESQKWMVKKVPKDVLRAEVQGLDPFTSYIVYVAAYSGHDLPSYMHDVKTSEGVPEVGPANLTAHWIKSNYSVLLTWSPIPQSLAQGHITHYVITYSNTTHSITKTTDINLFVMTRLPIFTEYTITVAGATSMGKGNESTIAYRTRGLPLPPPTNLTAINTTYSAINVSWIPIPDEPIFDKVIGYRLYYYDQNMMRRNLTVPANQTAITITGVETNHPYDFTVMGLTFGEREGRRASTSAIIIHITAPPDPPKNLNCTGISPYTISVGWHDFSLKEAGGSLTGYKLRYKLKGDPGNKSEVELKPHPPWYTLENLPVFTEYEIEVLVENIKGRSPWSNITCRTAEGVPTVIPRGMQAQSYVGETFITLSWEHTPINGTLSGYRVLYRKVAEAGKKTKDAEMKSLKVSASVTAAQVHGLDPYSKYCFQLSVFNEHFGGKLSSSVCAETCRCPQTFYTNWFLFDPYVVTSRSGIFPPLVKSMIKDACGPCKAYNDTVFVNFTTDGKGEMARKNSSKLVQLVKTEDATQFSYPVPGPIAGSGSFIPVVDDPESVFVTRKPVKHVVAQTAIGTTVINTLPLFAFMFLVMLLGGILMWAVEFRNEEEAFPKAFHKGVQQGFWWAFVSVTTVGYGDKVPNSITGRVLSMIWILYGTVLVGLTTVSLTMALNTVFVVISTDVTVIYGAQVAAIENSLEVQLGLKKGAHVNEGRNYSDVNSILQALENGDIDGALIDKLTAARIEKLSNPNSVFEIKDVFPQPSTYGIFLSGPATKLQKKFRQYLRNNAGAVVDRIKNYSKPLKTKEDSTENQEEEEEAEAPSQSNIISGSSPMFLTLLLWLIGVLIFFCMIGLAWHFLYYKHVAKVAKNKVCAVQESKTEISSLKDFATEFREDTFQKLRDMKYRHVRELRVLCKFKGSV